MAKADLFILSVEGRHYVRHKEQWFDVTDGEPGVMLEKFGRHRDLCVALHRAWQAGRASGDQG